MIKTRSQILAELLQNNKSYNMGQNLLQQGMRQAYTPGQAAGNSLTTLAGYLATNKGKEQAKAETNNRNMEMARMLSDVGVNVPQGGDAGMAMQAALLKRQLAPDPVDTFETIKDPFGKGGVGQKNTRTGQIVNYQAPEKAPTETWGSTMEVSGPDGNPMLVQVSNMGNTRPIEGYGPKPPKLTPGVDVPLSPEVAAQREAIAAAAKGSWETVEGPDGQVYQVNSQTNERKALPKGDQMTEGQANNATFADRVFKANAELANIDPAVMTDSVQHAYALAPGGNYLMTPEYQKYAQLKRDFINAVLRNESGAVIGVEEFKSAEAQYFPQPGDSPEVIAQKAKNRATVAQGLARSAGSTYKPPVLEVSAPEAGVQPKQGQVQYGGETYDLEEVRQIARQKGLID